MPSATASDPTLSPSHLSSSRCSAAARLVGSIRSRDPGMSPSRDRSSWYVGPPSLKCATLSRVAPSSEPGEPPDGGRVAPPCVYLHGLEHVSGVAYWAGAEGRPDERGHIPIPPPVWPPGRPQPPLGRRVPRVIGARPPNHGGPWPGVRCPPLGRDGGVLLRGGPWCERGGAPPAPFARPLLPHYARVCRRGGPTLSLWLACPAGGCVPRAWWGADPWGVAFHRWEGRLVSGAVPLPAACPWGRAARTRCPSPVGVGTQHRPHSVRSCEPALRAVGVAGGRPRGGALRRCEGCLSSGALSPPAARPQGGLSGSATHVLWARVSGRGGPAMSLWLACPAGGCVPRVWPEAVPGVWPSF